MPTHLVDGGHIEPLGRKNRFLARPQDLADPIDEHGSHAIRIAVTGKPAGFGMFETLAILGKEKVAVRIDQTLERAATICVDA